MIYKKIKTQISAQRASGSGLKITLILTALLCLVQFSGCSRDNEGSLDEGTPQEYVLRLNILAESSSTRTERDILEDGSEAESYIDPEDICLVLYKPDGSYLTMIDDAEISPTEISGKKYYFIEKSYTPEEINEFHLDTDPTINILVLANWNRYESSQTNKYPSEDSFKETNVYTGRDITEPQKEKNLWLSDNGLVFNTQSKSESGMTKSWIPGMESKSYIPMFGYKNGLKFNLRGSGITSGNYSLTQIQMLRALAKIEIVDATPEGYEITDAKLSLYNTTGRLIPDITANEKWDDEDTQITFPTLPSYLIGQNPSGSNLTFVQSTSDGKKIWTAYIPEMELTGNRDILSDRACIKIKGKVADTNTEYNYDLHFGDYLKVDSATGLPDMTTDSKWGHILRNHIYRFTINSLNFWTSLTLNVLPWNMAGEELWWYEDIPEYVKPEIKWEQSRDIDEWEPSVTLNLSSDSKEILKGIFNLKAPKGGTWHAYLMTIGDAIPTAIEFCNADGSQKEDENEKRHISGEIGYDDEGTNIIIYLRPEDPEALQKESIFKLVVMVENLGNWMEVIIVPTNDDGVPKTNNGHANWEIIRPASSSNL
ncbi:MAG: hypothetical protein J1F12_00295 [Muribaculaceae bacterium]|nr:hypothetical protein [Muribaculaceae bacterium]